MSTSRWKYQADLARHVKHADRRCPPPRPLGEDAPADWLRCEIRKAREHLVKRLLLHEYPGEEIDWLVECDAHAALERTRVLLDVSAKAQCAARRLCIETRRYFGPPSNARSRINRATKKPRSHVESAPAMLVPISATGSLRADGLQGAAIAMRLQRAASLAEELDAEISEALTDLESPGSLGAVLGVRQERRGGQPSKEWMAGWYLLYGLRPADAAIVDALRHVEVTGIDAIADTIAARKPVRPRETFWFTEKRSRPPRLARGLRSPFRTTAARESCEAAPFK